MNQENNLNLARKWRPKTFDQIAGQEIPVKMLQNSLFLNKLFPVYLFAGQRGCGKTSTARIFAAAINCKNLEKFQKNPKKTIPCLECDSCKYMLRGNNPDFIEIDAASHTGVDNVRQILENCSYTPLAGTKKIYLIDESHMLSKAAFNAFLKVLEEPPTTALFVLVTTEIHKIPKTVLSRCFQVMFTPVKANPLKQYLQNVCVAENINIEKEAIDIIIEETDGSVRDAINLLERVRFSAEGKITTKAILRVLGKISEQDFVKIFETLIDQNPAQLIEKLQNINFGNINPQMFWKILVQTCRNLIWIKYGAQPKNKSGLELLSKLAKKVRLERILAIFQMLWDQESLFLQTNQKHIFLENLLIQICNQMEISQLRDLVEFCKMQNNQTNMVSTQLPNKKTVTTSHAQSDPNDNFYSKISIDSSNTKHENQKKNIKTSKSPSWEGFLAKLSQKTDPLLLSIIKQAKFVGLNKENKTIQLALHQDSDFFKEKVAETRDLWLEPLQEQFEGVTGFNFIESEKQADKLTYVQSNNYVKRNYTPPTFNTNFKSKAIGSEIDISDEEKWPKANLIRKHFPGKIVKIGNK